MYKDRLQLAMQQMGLFGLSNLTGKGVTIALLDSGVYEHPDLIGKVSGWHDFLMDSNQRQDPYGHGTHLASLMVGSGTSQSSFAGLAPSASLWMMRVLNHEGVGREQHIVEALQWMLHNHKRYQIQIVNLSLGTMVDTVWYRDPICITARALWRSGVVVVAPAGNEGSKGQGNIRAPGLTPEIITVGSLAIDGTIAPFSSWGIGDQPPHKPDLLAPGEDVIGARVPDSYLDRLYPKRRVSTHYMAQSGTSVSTALVSATVALLLEKEPHLTPDAVKARLQGACVDLGLPQYVQGAGKLWLPALFGLI